MNIAALALYGNAPWPDACVEALAPGLNVFYGPAASGKTVVADLVAHALFGRRLMPTPMAHETTSTVHGDVVVESNGHRYRLKRSHDDAGAERLTVAPLDGAPVDSDTVQRIVYGLPPTLAGPMYSVDFRSGLDPQALLVGDFAAEFRAAFFGTPQPTTNSDALRPLQRRIHRLEWELTALSAALGYRRIPRPLRTKPRPTKASHSASQFLAKLTDGELRRLEVKPRGRGVFVVDHEGSARTSGDLSRCQRDQIYLSVCLALVSAAVERGIHLPLVLDEPFAHLDRRGSVALVAVVEAFAASGQQILLFTERRDAAELFARHGTALYEMQLLYGSASESGFTVVADSTPPAQDSKTRQPERRTRVVKRKRRQAG